jgi:predicted phosphodiesterase
MSPYLQALTTNSVTVLVECDSKEFPQLVFGKTPDMTSKMDAQSFNKTDYSRPTFVYRIVLNNLEPGIKYFYKVSQGKSQSQTNSFKTLLPNAKSLRIAVYGDNRSNPKMFSKITDNVIKHDPDFIILTGDLSYNNKYESFKEEFFTKSNLDLLSKYCFFNATGNHEGWSNNTRAFVESPKSESGTNQYYSFEFGDYHFLILNQYVDYSKGSDQWNFAKSDLEKSKAKYKFVAVHKPGYCAGGHNEDDKTIKMSKDIFTPNGVTMLFAGHSHFYQKNLIDGVYHFVLGGAGAPLYNPESAAYTLKSIKAYHFSILTIVNNKVKMEIFNEEDKIIDTLEFTK